MPRYKLRTLLILLAVGPMVLAYVPGYFWMGKAYPSYKIPYSDAEWLSRPRDEGAWVFRIVRRYPHKWQKRLYQPIGKLESWLRGIEVYIELPPADERREIQQAEASLQAKSHE